MSTGRTQGAAAASADGITFCTSFVGVDTAKLAFRTDLGHMFFYTGGRWLTTQVFTEWLLWIPPAYSSSISATDSSSGSRRAGTPYLNGGSDIYLVNHRVVFIVITGGTALSASHKWVGVFNKMDASQTGTTLTTTTIDSGSSAVFREQNNSINALLYNGSTYYGFYTVWTKTGTPGNLTTHEEISYRLVGA